MMKPQPGVLGSSAKCSEKMGAGVQSSFAEATNSTHPKDAAVLIVILNWNSHVETIAAVASVLTMDYPSFNVVVIDNGSTDGSLDALKEIVSSRVQLIASPENIGFTGGCNLGFELALKSDADFVWLLNNDAVTDAGTLTSLVRTAQEDERIGLVSPVIASLDEPSRLINAGGIFDSTIPDYTPTKDLQVARAWAANHPEKIVLLGTALLVRTSLIRKIGPLDPALFAYWEDTDFSLRSIRAGYRNVVDFDAVIYHSEKFPGDRPHEIKPHYWYYLARNEIYFWKKHTSLRAGLRQLWWTYQAQLRILNRLRGNTLSRRALLAGLWDGWTGRTGAYSTDLHMPSLFARAVELHSSRYKDAVEHMHP